VSDLGIRPLRHALKQAAVTGTTGSLLLGAAVVGVAAPGATAASGAAATATATKTATAQAAPVTIHTQQVASKKRKVNVGKMIATAASLKGRPYRYGATGPRAFDCSGYTLYVLKKQGIKLARTSSQQYAKSKHVSKRHLRTGDLIFYYSGSRVYHVAIYAGKGKMWHAPHTGTVVKLVKVYGSNWKVGKIA